MSFRVDTLQKTFVFDRRKDESPDETQWLIMLSRVGLINVTKENAIVNYR
jgi:hypothetical protein